ncbi:MAG: hypothetical protein J5958_07650 [Clostridia bacterium]|nr:hypothetical protein [Clostridia bacterium]
MKRFVHLVVLLVLLAILCPVLIGCSSGKNQPTIVYDKKYEYGSSENYQRFFVFHSDHTGYFEAHLHNKNGSVNSGRFDFFWRISDDGMVYLFGGKITYFDDDTEGKSFANFSSTMPITFGDGFLVALNTSSTIDYANRFILEGSDLAKDIEKGIDAED